MKQGFRRTISRNKYRTEITTQSKSNKLDYVIDPAFKYINRRFVFSFKNGEDDPTRIYFDEYFITLAEIKCFNDLIDRKHFLIDQEKVRRKRMKKLLKYLKTMTIQQEAF